jgi:hypothetical protein
MIYKTSLLNLLSLFIFGYTFAQMGDDPVIEKSLKQRNDIIFYGEFEQGFYNIQWQERWGIQWITKQSRTNITQDEQRQGQMLRVEYPKGGLGPQETGVQFPIVFRNMKNCDNGLYREAYFRYYVKFEKGFDFNRGGKLPGLMGGGRSWVRSGGNQPDGTNGWTLRFMWRKNGELVIYAYVPKSNNGKWGSQTWGQDISTAVNARPGRWYCIEQYVNVGTPEKDNGILKVWINGKEKISIDDMLFWNTANNAGKIGGIYFSTFHGGNTRDWAPQNDSYARFDGLVVAKERILCDQ